MNSQKFGMTLGSFFLVCSSVAHAYGSAVDLKSAPVQETPKQAANGSNDCRTRFTNIISGRIMADLPVGRWSNRITNGLKAEDRYMRACVNSVSLWKGDKLNVEESNALKGALTDTQNQAANGSNDCRTRFTNIISGRIMADLPVGRWSNRITNGLKAEDRYMRACLNSVSLWKGDKLNVEEGNILRNTLIDALNGASDSDKTKIRSALAVINSQVAPETVRTADRGTFSAH